MEQGNEGSLFPFPSPFPAAVVKPFPFPMSPAPAVIKWRIRSHVLELGRPLVMGILNLTPDSFSDGGRFFSSHADVFDHVAGMLHDGADIIDVGGESTRPGAVQVSENDERNRVLPVIEGLVHRHPKLIISIDTVKSGVALAALQAGAHIVNDVSGLRLDPGIASVCARENAGLVLMHSRGTNVTELGAYTHATYDNVVGEVLAELRKRVDSAHNGGVPEECIAVDPGIGFSKRSEHSVAMLEALPQLAAWGYPVVVGVSRKRFIGDITGVKEPAARLSGTLGANVAALAKGARIFRVHDVRPAREALDVAWAILRGTGHEERGRV
jgi:dihydropteroate synthase